MEEKVYIDSLILKHLNQEASPVEVSAVQQWLDADPANRQHFEALEKIWTDSGPALHRHSFDKDRAWGKMQPRLIGTKVREEPGTQAGMRSIVWKKKWMVAAATLLILVSAGWWMAVRKRESFRVIVAQQGNQQLSLPDGSVVTLRKGAMIRYAEPFKGKQRQVEMSGEVFFQPSPDPRSPFRISTTHALIEDIGTSFLVKDQEGAEEVSVATGKVKVTDKTQSFPGMVLVSGQKAIWKEHRFIQSVPMDSNFMAWKTGILNFRDTPLPQAAAGIADFYQLTVSFSPDLLPEAGKIKITARYDNQSLEEVLEELRLTTGLKINHEKNTLFFHRP